MTAMAIGGNTPLARDSSIQVLLVEDAIADSDLAIAMLDDQLPQAQVHVAATLRAALEMLRGNAFDVVLADLSLPDAEGLAVVEAIGDEQPHSALVVLTGRNDGELALRALSKGAQDYLVKGDHDSRRLATALLHALQRQRTELEAHRHLQLAVGLLDAVEAPTCAVRADSRIVAVNEAWRDFMVLNGGRADSAGEGTNYLRVLDDVADSSPEAFDARAVAVGMRDVLGARALRYQYEYPCPGPLGESWFSVRIAPAEIEGLLGAVVSHVDVTAMHVLQRSLAHQSLHDHLTGLPNRLLLRDRLEQALADSKRRDSGVAVAILDLDRFKRVNDSLGHLAGDDLLVQVAGRLQGVVRDSDTLARFAGDEFVVVWRDFQDDDHVAELTSRLLDSLVAPFDLGRTFVTIAASIGVVVCRSPQEPDELFQAADAAMYEAKRLGRGRVHVYSPDLRVGVQERLTTESRLREAIAELELVVHYQPVIDLMTGEPVAVEALVRWRHPERGLLGPGHFVPIAESSGLIEPLGAWVLNQACIDGALLNTSGARLDMAVNLSVRQLTQPDLVDRVRQALAASGLAPERLLLEVTESAMMDDEEAAASALNHLSELGVRIAIDDFGTGYSSLLYLRRYPISALKLDREFVAGIDHNPDDEAICSSVVSLARAVGATSIAEGVETFRQYAALRAYGCQMAQGFLWSPAVPFDELPTALEACRTVPVVEPLRRKARVSDPLEPTIAARIQRLHKSGASLHTIAAAMNRDSIPNPVGDRWTASTIAHHISE